MSAEHDNAFNQGMEKAVLFLETLRKSSRIARDLINNNREMSLRIQSLESELSNSKARIAFLEREINQLRNGLAKLAFEDDNLAQQFQDLLEEQNCLAHMFVTSEQLSQVRSAEDVVRAATEVLHNLIGARTFGIWFRWDEMDQPVLVAPNTKEEIRKLEPHVQLLHACLDTGTIQQPNGTRPDEPPICFPIRLESRTVGALIVIELVPQQPNLERLQRDLLSLLSSRLARAVIQGASCTKLKDQQSQWADLRSTFADS